MNAGDCNGRSYVQGESGFKMNFLSRKLFVVFIYLYNVLQVTEARRQRISAAALLRRLPTVSSPPHAVLSAVSCPFAVSLRPHSLPHTHLFSLPPV